MNITIKPVKRVVLLLSALSTLSIYSMESQKSVEIDENCSDIREDFREMCRKRHGHCSFLQDALTRGKCTESFIKDYSEKRTNYLLIKYTNLCADQKFSRTWSYDRETTYDTLEDQKVDNLQSNENIYACAQKCLAQYNEKYRLVKEEHILRLERKERKDYCGITILKKLSSFIRGTQGTRGGTRDTSDL